MSNRYINRLPGVPFVESPFFHEIFDSMDLDAETRRIANDLNRDGFAVLDFPDPDFDRHAEAIKKDLKDQYDWKAWSATGFDRGDGLRVQDAWQVNTHVKQIAVNPKILALLETLYGRPAHPFQTLNFPVGTQQHFHTDSIHFSCVPERFMCGVWVALEDVDEESGPLVYYPGSHKWPIYLNEHVRENGSDLSGPPNFDAFWEELVRVHNVKPQYFLPKKGQCLIWAANLLHGGGRQTNKQRTRWSQVTHYFFDNCAYYTPLFSDPITGKIYFRRPTAIESGREMDNHYVGRKVNERFIAMTQEGFPDNDPYADVLSTLNETKRKLAAMKRSTSWRVTAPLRWLRKALGSQHSA